MLDIDGEYKKRQNTKMEDEFQKTGNYSDDELRFVVFCIESLAEDMNVDPIAVHDALTKESDIDDQYIIPCYEMLHTQGKEYMIENLKEVMKEGGHFMKVYHGSFKDAIGRLAFEKPNFQICLRTKRVIEEYMHFERSYEI